VAGINTFFQTFFGTRLPAVIGGSYTFVPTTISIILAGRYSDIVNPLEVSWFFTNLVVLYVFFFFSFFVISSSLFTCIATNMQKFEKIMRGTQGALIVASTLQIVLGFSGLWRNVVRLLNLPCLK